MTPQFNSPELNRLLQLELAEGRYNSSEDALLAGLRILRENRAFQHQLADRLTALSDGRAIELKDETELGRFSNLRSREHSNPTRKQGNCLAYASG